MSDFVAVTLFPFFTSQVFSTDVEHVSFWLRLKKLDRFLLTFSTVLFAMSDFLSALELQDAFERVQALKPDVAFQTPVTWRCSFHHGFHSLSYALWWNAL